MRGAIQDVVMVASPAIFNERVHTLLASLFIYFYIFMHRISMLADDHVIFRSQLVGTILIHLPLKVLRTAEVYQSLAHPSYQDLLLEL